MATKNVRAPWSTRQRVILIFSVVVFALSLASDWHRFYPMLPSPRGLLACLWALVTAFCMALFVGWFLNGVTSTQKRVPELASNRRSARRQLILIAVCIVLAFGYLLSHRIHELWVDRTVDAAFGTAISLLCWGCLIVFWMPKPSQMSANQPELLHVVPTRPAQNDRA